jgi:signal transduction histidine kinase
VEDTGVGMTEEVLDQLFVPFFTTKEINQGTGLGLPVVHGIVTSHGGTIEIKSKPGKGTKFTIRLPIEPGTIQENREEL